MQAEIAKMASEGVDTGGFGQALADAGIEATVTPKEPAAGEEPAAAPAEAETAVAGAAPEPDATGLDALTEAVGKGRMSREEQLASRDKLFQRAEAAQLPPSIAKALANHADRNEVEAYLGRLEGGVQLAPAGQPAAPAPQAPTVGATAPGALAEVQGTLNESLGEGPAQVVIDMIRQANERAERAEKLATQATQSAAHESGARSVMEIAREMSGELPGLLRGDQIDPNIGQVAADLYVGSGPYAGDLRAAMRMAHQTVMGGQQEQPRQTTSTTPTTTLPQSQVPNTGVRRISKDEFSQRAAAVAGKYANQPAEFERQMALLEEEVRRTNEIAAQHGL